MSHTSALDGSVQRVHRDRSWAISLHAFATIRKHHERVCAAMLAEKPIVKQSQLHEMVHGTLGGRQTARESKAGLPVQCESTSNNAGRRSLHRDPNASISIWTSHVLPARPAALCGTIL